MNQPQPQPDHDPEDDAVTQAEAIVEDALARDGADELESEDAGESDAGESDAGQGESEDALTQAQRVAAEHLADLQRLQAEFVNYRKRVDRDRATSGAQATTKVIESLIPALDDIAAARDHGDLTDGPFAAIADKLEEALGRLGWERYGAPGDSFDPAVHEALMSQPSADVTEPTVEHVAQPGHRMGDRVIRAARVVVSQPE